jgi:tetratricopeptide (TPR) repeat protein
MDGDNSKQTTSDISHIRQRRVQNYLLIWVDANIDQSNRDCQDTLTQFRNIVNDVNICIEPDQCIQCLNDIGKEKAFIIASGSLGQYLVPHIHAMPQVDAIYIFCGNKSQHEVWTKNWAKIKGVYTDIEPIYKALQFAVKQYNEDSISMSFVSASQGAYSENLNQLEPSFMYTQIFKEILLDMQHHEQANQALAFYCRQFYKNNAKELMNINEFEHDYNPKAAIWWYTRECFLHEMLNRALRTLEGDTIVQMGCYIHDLHRQIEELHQKQIGTYQGKSFIVYRGQGLSTVDFEKIRKTKGGLISFNSFLSTSKKRDISLEFATNALGKTNTVGVLFQMTIDPSVSSTPFAAIKEVSYFQIEEEILFSMHTVFRIGDIIKMDKNNSLYQVELTLTADDDEQLRTLTDSIRKETAGAIGWTRLARLLQKTGDFPMAEEIYRTMLEQASNQDQKAVYYNNLGYLRHDQGDYKKAIWYYEQALEIQEKTLSPNDPRLAKTFNNIGMIYECTEEYPKALSFLEKNIEILEKAISPNYPLLATGYNNIGLVYSGMGEYLKSLSFYEKAFEIRQKILPANHRDLATSYGCMGAAYENIGEYSKALPFLEKNIQIQEKTLPPYHPDLANSYSNIAFLYQNVGECRTALSYLERARDMLQRSLPPNHPHLQNVQLGIKIVKESMQ